MSEVRTTLKVAYDSSTPNSPLLNHEIDVQALGQFLQGLGSMILAANKVLNDDQEISVRVKAGFNESSFEIPLEIIQLASSLDVLKVIGLSAAGGSFALGGALEVIKKLKNRRIDKIEHGDETNKIVVDGESIECSDRVRDLVINPTFRKAVNKAIGDPATSLDVSKIKFTTISPEGEVLTLELDGDTAKEILASEDVYSKSVETDVYDAKIKFLSAYAERPGGWNIDILGTRRTAELQDEEFLNRLSSPHGSISFGITYRATIKETRTSRHGGRALRKFAIIKVFEPED